MTQMEEAAGFQYSLKRLLSLRRFDPNSFGDLGISLIEVPEATQRAKPRKAPKAPPLEAAADATTLHAAIRTVPERLAPSEETSFGAPGLKVDPRDLLPDWTAPPTGPPPGFIFDAPPQSSLEDDGFWAESMHPNLATAALQQALGLMPPLQMPPLQPPWPLGYPAAVPGLVPPWALQTEPLLAPPELAPPELAPPELAPPELAPPELVPPQLPEPVAEVADAPAEGAGRWRRRAARAAVDRNDEGQSGGGKAEPTLDSNAPAEGSPGRIAAEVEASAVAEPEGASVPDAMQAMADEDPTAELSEEGAQEVAVNGAAEKKKSKKKKKKNKKEEGPEDAAPALQQQVPQMPQVLSAHFSKTRFAGLDSDSEQEQKPVGKAKAKPKAKAKEAKPTAPATTAPVAKAPAPPAAAKVPPAKVPPPVAPPAAAKAPPAAAKMIPPTATVKVPPPVAANVAPVQPVPVQPLQAPRPVAAPVVEAKKAPEGNRSGGINGEVKQSFKAPPGVAVKPAPPKAKAKAVPGMNPLPQQIRPKAPVSNGWNPSSLTMRYAERPVEKVTTSVDDDVDPDLQCYIWDSRSQQPRQPRQPIATGRTSVPNAKQRQLLNQVVEMGFNETDAKRALSSTGWSGVQDAVAVLVGG